MCGVETSDFFISAYELIRDWQTVWVTAITVLFAVYTWEVTHLIQVLEKKFPVKIPMNFNASFAATRLLYLPKFFGVWILKGAVSRYSGDVVWKPSIESFKSEHDSFKANRKKLKGLFL